MVFGLTQIPRIPLIFWGGKSHRIVWWESGGGFWAHTDPTNLTDFFVGGKSHRIVRWGVGVVFGLTQIPRIPLIFLWVVNLTEFFSGGVSREFIYLCGDCVC